MMNQRLRSKAATNLRTPNATARPATSVTANAASTSQPPGVPADAKPQRGQTRTDQREDGDARRALPVAASRVGQPREQRADSVLSRYSSCPIAQKTTSGTSATSRNSTARGQLHPAGLSSNTFDSQLTTFLL
jgi:hypothetical protein